MNIFLTGATGGLGSLLASRLQILGHSLVALTRGRVLPGQSRIRFVQGDLLDPEAYAGELGMADAIIHLAAVTHSPRPEAYARVNTGGTRLLLETAANTGFSGRFLFVSTRATGEACGAYGASKARAEALVRESPFAWTILRPAEVYGAAKGEAVSSLISMARSSFFIPVPGRGHDRLSPVHVDDVLGGILEALVRDQSVRKTYTLAGPEEMNYSELVRRLLRINGRTARLVPVPYGLLRILAWGFALAGGKRPPLVPDQIMRLRCSKCTDIVLATRELGYRPRTIEEGVSFWCKGESTVRRG